MTVWQLLISKEFLNPLYDLDTLATSIKFSTQRKAPNQKNQKAGKVLTV